jgi:microcystin-dependent protein
VGTLTSLSVSGTSALAGVVTAPTAANGIANTQVATTAFVQNSLANSSLVPSGVILLWSGSVASIPAGWLLCDGTNGTPDLRDRFVVGAGSAYNPGVTGGSANAIVVSHTHTASSVVTDPGHNHTYNAPSGFTDEGFSGSAVESIVVSNTGNAVTGITVATTVASTGSSGTNANLPPYYALAYIMKA